MSSISLTLSSKIVKDTGKAEILLRYRNTRDVALRAKTHIFILPKFFSNGKIVIKSRIITDEVRDAHKAQADIGQIIDHLIQQGNKMHVAEFTPTWAQDTIDRLLFPEKFMPQDEVHSYFFESFENFLKFKKLSAQRKVSYRCIFNIIRRYELYVGRPVDLNTATPDTLLSIEDFFRNEHKLFEEKKLKYRTTLQPVRKYKYAWENGPHEKVPRQRSENAIITYMSAVRAFWRWCIDMGYTTNDPFRKYSIKSQSFGTPFYLTTEERDKLYKTDLRSDPKVQMARDIFVFQCYVGCRRGDLFNLTKDNVVKTENGTCIQYIPSKTKDERPRVVKVYLTPTAMEIMERYKKRDPRHLFPFIGAGEDNDLIKKALLAAGIDRIVTVLNKTTGETEQRHLYEVGTSHMARRTFVGNLYKKVKDPNLVGKLSGHCEGSKAFARYRDIDDDMIREMTDLLD